IAHYQPNGKIDTGFGNGGSAQADVVAYSIALQSDGKILVGGDVGSSTAVYRLTSDGGADLSFGSNGIAQLAPDVTAPGEPGFPDVTALAIQPDGKILAAAGSDLFRLLSK